MNTTLPLLHVALKAAVEASEQILQIYTQEFEIIIKNDGSPVTEADTASSQILETRLVETQIPVLSEESSNKDYSWRKDQNLIWIVDPLDGTKEFIQRNDEFCINVALVENGVSILGIIVSPTEKKILLGGRDVVPAIIDFSEINNPELWQPVIPEKTGVLTVIASRSHGSSGTEDFIQQQEALYGGMKRRKLGSALKFFELARNTIQLYPRIAPTMEWDIAAGQAILEALGGNVMHADTLEPLRYNKENLLNPPFIAHSSSYPWNTCYC